jgi:hypothetical protein
LQAANYKQGVRRKAQGQNRKVGRWEAGLKAVSRYTILLEIRIGLLAEGFVLYETSKSLS